ncbi:MraY family glycosyltransferase [Micrococcoides hystricis]|uniref:MraY family glycosyltransferase n=1 Tax=Micrococcoides hystricis TaxID=1572761 RepID=A0ABV6PBT1_9MICC
MSAAISFVLTPMLRRVGLKFAHRQVVRSRDIHTNIMPRLGGVAMLLAVSAGLALASKIPFTTGIFTQERLWMGIFAALAIILVMGVLDDLFDLPWWVKILGQIGASLVVALNGIRIQAMPVGWIHITDYWMQILLTVILIVGTMNAFNFVDGLDGLATGMTVIGGSAFFVYTYLLTRSINEYDFSNVATLLMAVLIGAAAGFLPHNFYPARIFMGEVGSTLLGFTMAIAAILVTADVGALDGFRFRNVPAYMPILLPISVMLVPIIDMLVTVTRRTARGVSPFSADRGHLHHKLIDGGYNHPQAVWVLYAWSAVVAFGAVALNFIPWTTWVPIWAVLIAGCILLTIGPWLQKRYRLAKVRRRRKLLQRQRAERQMR